MERITYKIADSRICVRCGARAGKCSHLPRHEHEIEIAPPSAGREPSPLAWSDWEVENLRKWWEAGFTSYQIAEALNRSRSAVTAVVCRLGIQRKAA